MNTTETIQNNAYHLETEQYIFSVRNKHYIEIWHKHSKVLGKYAFGEGKLNKLSGPNVSALPDTLFIAANHRHLIREALFDAGADPAELLGITKEND